MSTLGELMKNQINIEMLDLKKKHIAKWFKSQGRDVPNLDFVKLSDEEPGKNDSDISDGGVPN